MTVLVDSAGRERIDSDLDKHLFVKAGAGSGKTHHLVRRILALVASGVPLRSIAAVTFTEKAAGELRERVRNELGTQSVSLGDEQRKQALDELDSAPIGTIHSFATRILEDNPIEAGLPPAIEVMDELRSQIAFGGRWRRVRAALFSDDESSLALEVLLAAGMTLGTLEEVTKELDSSWDRLSLVVGPLAAVPSLDLASLLRQAIELFDRKSECHNPEDKLLPRFDRLHDWISLVREAIGTEDLGQSFELLANVPGKGTGGQAGNWTDAKSVKLDFEELVSEAKRLAAHLIQPAISRVLSVIGEILLDEATARQRSGQLEFHDLLVLSRNLLVGSANAEVHARLHARYQRILLDEFQDTDPLQAELAIRIAAPVTADLNVWRQLEVPPGRVFMVGDPKQSIYRFRRADIATYLELLELSLDADAHASVSMITNFRSTEPVLNWINTVFGTLIVEDSHRQPAYESLTHNPDRPEWDEAAGGPAVLLLGATDDERAGLADASTAERREREALDVASVIVEAMGQALGPAWLNEHPKTFARTPMELKDICILLPSRASLPALENALEAMNIDFIAEASSLVYSTQEIHDLLLTLQALANTADEAALALALRTPLFACGDDDLLQWSVDGGRWNVYAPIPLELGAHPVSVAMAYLRDLHHAAVTSSPADLLDRLVTDRFVREVALDSPRYRDVWRRIRFVIDQARAWSEATFGSLRDYLDWTESQSSDGARVKESIVPDSGLNAVRITTIHGAKGRQFPMVILSGMSSSWRMASSRVFWDIDSSPLVSFKASSTGSEGVSSVGYSDASLSEKSFLTAERLRLLYVACTRAESHLVVSAYPPKKGQSWTTLMVDGLKQADSVALELDRTATLPPLHSAVAIGALPAFPDWQRERAQWSEQSAVRASISVTAQAKGGQAGDAAPLLTFIDEAIDGSIEPLHFERTEEGGTEFGTAVHRVLELSDLDPSAPIEQIAVNVAAAAGLGNPGLLFSLAHNALASHPVSRASARDHWLELPVTAFDGSLVLEGIADLVYREDDGSLVIVDFKTDVEIREQSLKKYWRQLTAYAELIATASGEKVSRLELVFCRESPARVISRSSDE
ncbi:MAG: UvrD-helicase domain-containing protein [Salinibacterium sp.]|nr:UvrD-helicase domain-containing protein [Salinibacterium sp.]